MENKSAERPVAPVARTWYFQALLASAKDTQVVHSELRVDLEGDEIVVTFLGTKLRASYSRSHEAAQLIQRPYMATDNEAQLSREEFEALAWEAANEKARELGWLT